jgi:RNA polymerase sigma-70 factor (ECF subfamily)
MPKEPLSNKPMDDDFETIYKTNEPLIHRFMFWRTRDEMLAQDLTSHVFEKAWRTRASFKGGSSKAWLYRIARTTLIDYWRKKKDLAIDDEISANVASDAQALDEALDYDLRLADLKRALNRLPKEMHEIVNYRFIEGLSAKETAARAQVSEANVRVIQYRALKKLRGYL